MAYIAQVRIYTDIVFKVVVVVKYPLLFLYSFVKAKCKPTETAEYKCNAKYHRKRPNLMHRMQTECNAMQTNANAMQTECKCNAKTYRKRPNCTHTDKQEYKAKYL